MELERLAREDKERYWPIFWEQWWKESGIPPNQRKVIDEAEPFARIQSRGGAINDAIAAVKASRGSLYLYGPVGTGKTLLACSALYNAMYKHAHSLADWNTCPIPPSFRFISTPRLLQEIKNSYDEGTSEGAIIDRYSYCRLLVLDDIGVESPTDWVRGKLFQIVDERLSYLRPTIFTSNCSIPQLESRLDERISDRIIQMCDDCVIKLDASSFRLERRSPEPSEN